MKTLDDVNVAGRRVLIRSDLNVPMVNGVITDDGRIRASMTTIREVVGQGAKVVVLAHLGRPGGVPDPALSLEPVARRLGELLGQDVAFAPASSGSVAEQAVKGLATRDVLVLENVRFDPRETSKVDGERLSLAEQYALLADVYISDGFGVVHRKQASVYDVAQLMPHAAGSLVRAEVEVLRRLSDDPARPYAVVLGGSKVSDKLAVIENLLNRVDRLVIGGGMVYTFLAAQGWQVGKSLLEAEQIPTVAGLIQRAVERGVELVLPTDIVVADRFAADAVPSVVAADAIPTDQMGLDIGPDSAVLFASRIADAQTVFWNGPMGVFEFPKYAAGTRAVARALRESPGLTVVGGGDSAAAIRTLGFSDDSFGHVSTGGGASLEYLEGKTLPGLAVLEK